MENNLSQSIQQQQKQLLSQRQQQSLELLHLPLQELDARINEELEKNPLLEEKEPVSRLETPEEKENSANDGQEEGSAVSADEAARLLWGDDLPSSGSYSSGDREDDGDFWSNSPAPPPSVDEQLETEIATSNLPERMKETARIIIDNLDEHGYLRSHLADLAMLCDADMEEMEQALLLVQSFDPPGIAARDLGECMRLQLIRKNQLSPLLEKLTQPDMLEQIAANHIPRIASELGVTPDEINEALGILRKLDPVPVASKAEETRVPELEILWNGTEYTVNAPFARERKLFISEKYEKLLLDPATSKEDRDYIREKPNSAKELIRSLQMRGDTLTGIGRVIVKTQRDFLDRGKSALKPLTMKQAGEELGLHETTISRAAADKFVRTPHGVFELRDFFSGGFTSSDGEDISARAVREKIRDLIRDEDPYDPLSDDKISGLLAEQGLDVARRTVAKYRDILKIPSTRLRKKYGSAKK